MTIQSKLRDVYQHLTLLSTGEATLLSNAEAAVLAGEALALADPESDFAATQDATSEECDESIPAVQERANRSGRAAIMSRTAASMTSTSIAPKPSSRRLSMACHLTGTIWIPLEEFYEDLAKEVRRDVAFADVEDLLFAPKTFDFGGANTLAEDGCFTGLAVKRGDMGKSLDEIDPSTALRFQVGLEIIWKLCEDYGVRIARHEVAYGVPKLDVLALKIDVVINYENVRATREYVDRIKPQWERSKPVLQSVLEPERCEECGVSVPDMPGGSLANRHHADGCSLYDPANP